MTRIGVIAQTADPARGSEFATGWGAIRRIYLDPRILCRAQVDIYVSENRDNRSNIRRALAEFEHRPRFVFLPQVAPQAHGVLGRPLRIAWQFRAYRQLRKGSYDLVHQVSPNSIAYLNPFFFRPSGPIRLVGPMRLEPRASIASLYWRDLQTLFRHLGIRAKEIAEIVLFAWHRRAVRRWAALHLSPFPSEGPAANELYCRETALLELPDRHEGRQARKCWRVVWSGLGDRRRKNQHLASRVVEAALLDPRTAGALFSLIGWEGAAPSSPRVSVEEALPRDRFLATLGPRTVYLCTSLSELNSVLAEEVLAMGGRVVAGPLPGFWGRAADGVTRITEYAEPAEWVDALAAIMRDPSGRRPRMHGSHEMVERVVQRILTLIAPSTDTVP